MLIPTHCFTILKTLMPLLYEQFCGRYTEMLEHWKDQQPLFLIMCVVYVYKFWPGVLCIVQLSRLSWNVCVKSESCANRSLLHTYSWVTNRLLIMLVSTTLGNIAFENFTYVINIFKMNLLLYNGIVSDHWSCNNPSLRSSHIHYTYFPLSGTISIENGWILYHTSNCDFTLQLYQATTHVSLVCFYSRQAQIPSQAW